MGCRVSAGVVVGGVTVSMGGGVGGWFTVGQVLARLQRSYCGI